MKTRNIFIFFILTGAILTLSACNKTTTSTSSLPNKSSTENQSDIALTNDNTKVETDFIIVDESKIKTGQSFFIKSTFAPEPYELTLNKIGIDNTIEISYSEVYLGSPCSSSNNISTLTISPNEKCLSSTTCDAGEKVCFSLNKKNKNIYLEYTVSDYDSGI